MFLCWVGTAAYITQGCVVCVACDGSRLHSNVHVYDMYCLRRAAHRVKAFLCEWGAKPPEWFASLGNKI